MTLHINTYSATDVGRVRAGNEDSLFAGTTVFAVADGMGGHQAGEVASETALGPIAALDDQPFPDAASAEESLVTAIAAANQQVIEKAASNPQMRGMGTTLTAVLLREDRIHTAHVGDSRAYLLRANRSLNQLTTDHTLVEELIREGRITRAEAAIHPQRSVITRAIGVDHHVDIDALPPIELQPGDQILLCSDGLTGPVSDRKIAEILAHTPAGEDACRALIDAANAAGGPDNITVVLLRISGDPRDAHTGEMPGMRAVSLGAHTTQELQPTPDGEGQTAVQIRTREESGKDFADSMRRYGAPQGVGARPDHTGLHRPQKGRIAAIIVAALVLGGLLTGGTWMLLSRAYFVSDHEGRVAIFTGVPQQVGGLRLHWVSEVSDLPVDELPRRLRNRVEQGVTVGSLSEGRRLIETYREESLPVVPRDASPPGGTAEPTPDPTAAPTEASTATP